MSTLAAQHPVASLSARRVVIVAGLLNTFASLARFMLGPLAVLISADLGLTETQVGAAVSLVVAVSAVASIWSGRFVERIGAYRAMMLVASLSAIVLLGIAAQVATYAHLLAWMVLSGVAMAMVHPATALAIAGNVAIERQGFAFGIKQSAPTTAALLAGFAVPTIGLTVGWRWAYVAAAAGAILVIFFIPRRVLRDKADGDRPPEIRSRIATLVILAIGMVFAVSAVSALAVFYVLSAVDNGIPVGTAGFWFAMGSAVSIVARLAVGWWADRRGGGDLRTVAAFMAAGTLGFVLLGRSADTVSFAIGTVFAFAAGWGWPGLFQLTVTRENAEAPAAATGITQTGAFVGSAAGPLLFGWLVERVSYQAAWWTAAGTLLAGAAIMLYGNRVLVAEQIQEKRAAAVQEAAAGSTVGRV